MSTPHPHETAPLDLTFDRGTLLLFGAAPMGAEIADPDVPAFPALPGATVRVPGLLWDPRVAAFRAPAYRYAELCRALKAAGVAIRDGIGPLLPDGGFVGRRHPLPDSGIEGSRPPLEVPWSSERPADGVERPESQRDAPDGPGGAARIGTWPRRVELRAHDLRPFQANALAAWQLAERRGIIALPTGSGKTHVALAALAALGAPALVLVPTRVLLAQWVSRLRAVYDGPIGVHGDGERSLEAITIATFESAYRHMDDVGQRFGLLVVDEVHHFASGQRAEALEMCVAPARLGLTATPPETPEGLARIENLVGPVVCRHTIAQLSDFLAPFDCISLPVSLTRAEQEQYRRGQALFQGAFRRFRQEHRGSWHDFVVSASATRQGRAALAGYHEARRVVSLADNKLRLTDHLLARHRGEPALLFTAENGAAYALSRRLLLPAITCDIGRAERAAILQRLREGKLRAVVSARVLNEGIDLPEARVGIILGGALGGREHVQRVGRLLRAAPGKRAIIYELIARETFELQHARRRNRYLVA
jgi:superfamily II DNA or RNA helicase